MVDEQNFTRQGVEAVTKSKALRKIAFSDLKLQSVHFALRKLVLRNLGRVFELGGKIVRLVRIGHDRLQVWGHLDGMVKISFNRTLGLELFAGQGKLHVRLQLLVLLLQKQSFP